MTRDQKSLWILCSLFGFFIITTACSTGLNTKPIEDYYGATGPLVELLNKGEYQKLEGYFQTVRQKQPKTVEGKDTLHELYYWFVRRDGVTEEKLNQWCLGSREIAVPFIVSGYYDIRTAWEARGKDVAYTVTEKGRELFRERLEKAQRDFTFASGLDSKDPIPFSMLIVVCRGLGLDRDKMEEYFLDALAADPTNYYAYYEKLRYLFPQWHGSDEEMLSFARSAALQAPPNTAIPLILAEAHWVLAKDAKDRRRYLSDPKVWDQINAVYSDFFKAFPRSASERASFARYAGIAGKEDLTLDTFSKAIELSPRNEIVYYERADFFRKKKEYLRAVDDYTRSIEVNPKYREGEAISQRGRCYYFLDRFDKALADFQKAIEIDTKDAENYYHIGMIKQKQKSYEEAIRYFSITVGLDPRYADAYSNRGVCYDLIHNEKLAVSDLKTAIRLDPRDPFDYNYVGIMLMQRNRYQEAIPFFSMVLALDANHKTAHKNRGVCYYKTKEYDKALLDFQNAIVLAPKDPYNYHYIGHIYKNQMRCEEAIPYFTKTIEIDERYEHVLYKRGVCYYLLDEYEKALADFRRAIELDPKDARSYAFIGHTYLKENRPDEAFIGHTYLKENRPDEAVKYYSRGLELEPKHKDALNGRGNAYLMAGQHREALKDFLQVLEIDPQDENANRNRAVASRVLGE